MDFILNTLTVVLSVKKGALLMGTKKGKWITWNENGQIISESVYKKGEKI